MNPTQLTARVLLELADPDPDSDQHMLDLARAVGAACIVDGCMNEHRCGGFCDTHYRYHRRAVANDAHLVNAALRSAT